MSSEHSTSMNVILLLGWKDAVEQKDIVWEADHIELTLVTKASLALCPLCGHPSSRIHSRYSRQVADLPCSGKLMKIILQVRLVGHAVSSVTINSA